MAKRAVYIASLLAVPERMQDRAPTDYEREESARFLHLGQFYRNTYLAVAHAEETKLSDSPREFTEFRKAADLWEARALSASRRLRLEDEKWHATWGGPSYRVETVLSDADEQADAEAPLQALEPAADNAERTPDRPLVARPDPATYTTWPDATTSPVVGGSGIDEPAPMRPPGRADRSSTVSLTRPEAWAPVPARDRSPTVSVSSTPPDKQAYDAPTCIFCDRPTGPVEYLWPEWICRCLTDQMATWNRERGTDDTLVQQMRTEVDQTVDCICETCIRGWIQHLDDDVVAFLTSMIAGDRTRLSPRKQDLLARWAAKTAAVVECVSNDRVRTPRSACEHLRRDGVPAGTQVLVGRYDGNARVLSHDRDLFSCTVDGTEQHLSQSTFVIGKVFIQVFADPWRDSTPQLAEDTTQLLLSLLPTQTRKVDWPPTISIDDSLYDLVRRGPT
ncbi:MAG: hypothetical protein ACLPVY_09980 [Acidimicrobiia bacterium]